MILLYNLLSNNKLFNKLFTKFYLEIYLNKLFFIKNIKISCFFTFFLIFNKLILY